MNLPSFLGNRLWKWVWKPESIRMGWGEWREMNVQEEEAKGVLMSPPLMGPRESPLPRSKLMLQWGNNIHQSFVQEFINAFWVSSTRSDPGNNLPGGFMARNWLGDKTGSQRHLLRCPKTPRFYLYVHWVGREAGQGSPGSGSQGRCPERKGWSDPMCRSKTPSRQ